ncbi:hypothetical protein [Streptomyces sp. NPDC102476]|uniref:hypothetical protein n=1 Tax=Streptomyces sp. NPDC102476 TaxID=3366181 RepID=UPI0038228C12
MTTSQDTGVQGSTLWLISIAASIKEPSSDSEDFNARPRQRLRQKYAAKDGSSWQIPDEISGL